MPLSVLIGVLKIDQIRLIRWRFNIETVHWLHAGWELPRTLALMQREKKNLIVGHSGLCAPGPVSVASLPWITATWVHSSHSQ